MVTQLSTTAIVLFVILFYTINTEHVEDKLKYCYPSEHVCKHGDRRSFSCSKRYATCSSHNIIQFLVFKALVEYHDILVLGKSPIKWRQRPDMTIAVDWDVEPEFKQHIYMSRAMRKPTFSCANTKTQTITFVFTTLKHRTIHLKFFSSFCDCTEVQVGNDQEKAQSE